MDNATFQSLFNSYQQAQASEQNDPVAISRRISDSIASIPKPMDTSIMTGASMGFKSQGASVYSGLGNFSQLNTGYGGDVANYFDDIAKRNQSQVNFGGFERFFNKDYYTNGQGLAYNVGGAIGSTAALLPVTLAVGAALPEVAVGATVGALGTALARVGMSKVAGAVVSEAGKNTAKWGIGNVASSVPESMSEGGNTGMDVLKETGDIDKSRSAANETTLYNLPLLAASKAVEFAGVKGFMGAFAVKPGGSVVANVAKATISNVTSYDVMNTSEEMGQQIISNNAMRNAQGQERLSFLDPNAYTHDVMEAGAAGLAGALPFAGVGTVQSLRRGYSGTNTNSDVTATDTTTAPTNTNGVTTPTTPIETAVTGPTLPSGIQEAVQEEAELAKKDNYVNSIWENISKGEEIPFSTLPNTLENTLELARVNGIMQTKEDVHTIIDRYNEGKAPVQGDTNVVTTDVATVDSASPAQVTFKDSVKNLSDADLHSFNTTSIALSPEQKKIVNAEMIRRVKKNGNSKTNGITLDAFPEDITTVDDGILREMVQKPGKLNPQQKDIVFNEAMRRVNEMNKLNAQTVSDYNSKESLHTIEDTGKGFKVKGPDGHYIKNTSGESKMGIEEAKHLADLSESSFRSQAIDISVVMDEADPNTREKQKAYPLHITGENKTKRTVYAVPTKDSEGTSWEAFNRMGDPITYLNGESIGAFKNTTEIIDHIKENFDNVITNPKSNANAITNNSNLPAIEAPKYGEIKAEVSPDKVSENLIKVSAQLIRKGNTVELKSVDHLDTIHKSLPPSNVMIKESIYDNGNKVYTASKMSAIATSEDIRQSKQAEENFRNQEDILNKDYTKMNQEEMKKHFDAVEDAQRRAYAAVKANTDNDTSDTFFTASENMSKVNQKIAEIIKYIKSDPEILRDENQPSTTAEQENVAELPNETIDTTDTEGTTNSEQEEQANEQTTTSESETGKEDNRSGLEDNVRSNFEGAVLGDIREGQSDINRESSAMDTGPQGRQGRNNKDYQRIGGIFSQAFPEELKEKTLDIFFNHPLAKRLIRHLSKRKALEVRYNPDETNSGRYYFKEQLIALSPKTNEGTFQHELLHDIQNLATIADNKNANMRLETLVNPAIKLAEVAKKMDFDYSERQNSEIEKMKHIVANEDELVKTLANTSRVYFGPYYNSIGFMSEILNAHGAKVLGKVLRLNNYFLAAEIPARAIAVSHLNEDALKLASSYMDNLDKIINDSTFAHQELNDAKGTMDDITFADSSMYDWAMSKFFKPPSEGIEVQELGKDQKLGFIKSIWGSPSVTLKENKLTRGIYLAGQAMDEARRKLIHDYVPRIRKLFEDAKNTKLMEMARFADTNREYADIFEIGDKFAVIDLSNEIETVASDDKEAIVKARQELLSKYAKVHIEENDGRTLLLGYDGQLYDSREQALPIRDARMEEVLSGLGYNNEDIKSYKTFRGLMDEFYELTAMVDRAKGRDPLKRRSGYSPHIIEKFILTLKTVTGKDEKGKDIYKFTDLSSHPTQADALKEAEKLIKNNPEAGSKIIVREKNNEARVFQARASYESGDLTKEEYETLKEAFGYTDEQAKANLLRTVNLFPSVTKEINKIFGRSNKSIGTLELARMLKGSADIEGKQLAESRLMGWLEGKESVNKRQVQAFLSFTQGKHKFAEYRLERKGNEAYIKDLERATYIHANHVFQYLSQEPFINRATRLYNKAFGKTIDADATTDLQRSAKDFIYRMRGTPSELDGLLDETVKSIPVLNKMMMKMFGDRPASTGLRVLSQFQSVSMLYLYNVSSAAMQFGSLLNINSQLDGNSSATNATKYLGVGKNTASAMKRAYDVWRAQKSNKWTEQTKKDYEILKSVSLELEQDLGYDDFLDTHSLYNMGQLGKQLEKSGMLFRGADQFMRRTAVLGYHAKGSLAYDENIKRVSGIISKYNLDKKDDTLTALKNKGLTQETMLKEKVTMDSIRGEFSRRGKTSEEQAKAKADYLLYYAKDSAHSAVFNYAAYDKAKIQTMGGALGTNIMQFTQYPIKQMEFILHHLRPDGKTNNAEMRTFVTSVVMLGGLFGLPGAGALGAIFGGITGFEPEKELKKKLMSWAGDNPSKSFIAKQILYGIGSHAGVDLHKRLGMGDFFPTKLADWLGPSFGSASRIVDTVHKTPMEVGSIPLYMRAILPAAGNYIMAGAGEARSVSDGGRLGVKYDPTDRVLRAMGFIPMEEALMRDKTAMIKDEENYRKERIKYAMEKLNFDPTDSRALTILSDMGVTSKQIKESAKKFGENKLDRAIEAVPKKRKNEYADLASFK